MDYTWLRLSKPRWHQSSLTRFRCSSKSPANRIHAGITILLIYLFISTLLNLANGDSLHWTICCSCLVLRSLSIPLSSPICLGCRDQAACQQQQHHRPTPARGEGGGGSGCETLRLECGCLNSSPVRTPLALMSTRAQGLRGGQWKAQAVRPPLTHTHAASRRAGTTVPRKARRSPRLLTRERRCF